MQRSRPSDRKGRKLSHRLITPARRMLIMRLSFGLKASENPIAQACEVHQAMRTDLVAQLPPRDHPATALRWPQRVPKSTLAHDGQQTCDCHACITAAALNTTEKAAAATKVLEATDDNRDASTSAPLTLRAATYQRMA